MTTGLDEAWSALRNGLSKAYVASDIDHALATARPRIEAEARTAALARLRTAVEGLHVTPTGGAGNLEHADPFEVFLHGVELARRSLLALIDAEATGTAGDGEGRR